MSDTRFDESLEIRCSMPGFRRCDLFHPAGPVVHKPGTFSLDQFEQLKAESRLLVTVLEAERTDANPTAETGNGAGPSGLLAAGDLDQLVAHIASLNPDDAKLWTKESGPVLKAMPDGTTAEQRDAAWAECLRRAEAGDQADEQVEG